MSAFSRDSLVETPALDRVLTLSRVHFELLAYALLVLASIVTHLWALGHMAMHHDESIHAWMSWKFFTGSGGFNCAGGGSSPTYCYDPVYHGPSLYVMTLISYFLFGVGEAQARLPQAFAGVMLVGSCWMLRPLFGRRAAFFAAVLLAFAPSILYYTRFARHDGLIILWTFWIVVGLFRFLQEGRARWLYLLAVGAALAVATHELYYILIFLFGFFLAARVAAELLPRRTVMTGLLVMLGIGVAVEIATPILSLSKAFSGLALLVVTVSALAALSLRLWNVRPLFVARGVDLWRNQRSVIWVALGIFAAIYVLLYTTFFTYPAGLLGIVQGIGYWLGSQQEYARGKQPWYYYLMLMPLYEPLGFFGGISVTLALFFTPRRAEEAEETEPETLEAAPIAAEPLPEPAETTEDSEEPAAPPMNPAYPRALAESTGLVRHMFPLFLAFWFIGAFVAFSWAGEKMPWLVIHIALPGNLLIAWGLAEMIGRLRSYDLPRGFAALVPATVLLLGVALSVMMWRFTPSGTQGMEAQSWLLAGLLPLVFTGLLIFALLTLAQNLGWRPTLYLGVLTISVLLGAYMVRATWMVVYDHPDTPRELLIYTQTSPDVPLMVSEITALSINQTRNVRTDDDPAGGMSMPVIMDIGDSSGEGSLAWPLQWYFRDFKRIESRNADFFRTATANSFDVDQSGAATQPAPVVLVSNSHITSATRDALEENYVLRYNSKLNWWFPEGDLSGCRPDTPGYKQFYYSSLTVAQAQADPQCTGIDFNTTRYPGPLAPFGWLLDRSHWADTFRFILWRDLPEPLQINGREMQMWVRKDLAPGANDSTSSTSTAASVRLLAEQAIGAPGAGEGQLLDPRGVAVDAQGNIYVADTGNNRVVVYDGSGNPIRTIGSFGSGEGQFNEPRGIALDAQGNLYVADTWNARIDKFDANGNFVTSWGEGTQDFGNGRVATSTDRTQAGNQANQLGFFGPRGVAVDTRGNVYIADTGNRRIVVTDTNGNYRYQWGYEGASDGQFNEPIGVGVDVSGNVYVADYWNGRVQVFSNDPVTQQVGQVPSNTWVVPGWQVNSYDDPSIAVGANGMVYVSLPNSNEVLALNTAGQRLLRWGGAGSDFASLNLPSGISVADDGQVYVVDRGNGRVMRYRVPAVAPQIEP